MKKIFPIITTLILLSLFGLIFFQYLWIKSAVATKDEQVKQNIIQAVSYAGTLLTQEKNSLMPLPRKSDLIFPGDKLQMQYFKPSVIKRFSKDEISDIIRMGFDKNNLKDYPFEFNVMVNTLNGDQVSSEKFFKYYTDTVNSFNFVYPLEPATGSNFENLVSEEFLMVVVPNQQTLIWK
jgi:two-component system, OmpR family, phosphate regulon sensor histidine kinase PhoR